MRAAALLVCFSILLAGCAQTRPPAPACAIRAYPIRSHVSDPVAKAFNTAGVVSYQEKLEQALGPDRRSTAPQASLLILSGGSQNGAFGGGLLYGLQDPTVYDVVTGVSTGAMQSTLAFIPREKVAHDRTLKDQGDGLYKMGRSNLEDLAVALSISRESTLLDKHPAGEFGAATSGSIGSLAPLKRRLLGLASEETLAAVGEEAAKKRLLMVGVTDLDDGTGYALDLTELASRILQPGAHKDAIRACYVDALVASSAVPIFAQPVMLNVSLDGVTSQSHLFIDGGSRYGVFLPTNTVIEAPDVTMIVNGPLYGGPWLDDKDKKVDKWNALQLVGRSVDVLINQVYRFSVDDVARFVRNEGGDFRLAFISNEGLDRYGKLPSDHVYQEETCSHWRKQDKKADPLEFHPKYMACLLDYGRKRGQEDPWNYVYSTPTKP